MLRLLGMAVAVSAAASISLAAGLPARGVSGNYIEARTADVFTGPCFANGEVEMNGVRYGAGQIIVIEPGEVTDFKAVTAATTAVVKIPGALNDKYMETACSTS